MSKRKIRAERQQQRAKQERQQRQIYIAAAAVAGLLLILAGIYFFYGKPAPGTTGTGGTPAGSGTCSDIKTVADEGRGHLTPGQTPTYKGNPPTSGIHDPNPMPLGIYPDPIDATREVHSLEHGYVILHYNGIAQDQINQLASIVKADPRKLILSPYPTMPYKISLTAWNHLQSCDGVNENALRNFINEFRDQGPELAP